MTSAVGPKIEEQIEISFDKDSLLKKYELILNPVICFYQDHDHPDLKGIKVKGLEKDMTDDHMKKIVTKASELFLTIRLLAHIHQKPNDQWAYPSKLKAYQEALAAYEAACKETGLAALSEPSLESLKKYVQAKHPNAKN